MLETPTPSLRMDGHHMTEMILDLILEIIYKLTGEHCEVVKMASGERLTSSSCRHRLPSVGHPTPDRYNEKILEVTNKIIALLMSEAEKLMEMKAESDEEETCVKSDHQHMEDTIGTVKKEEEETYVGDGQLSTQEEDMMETIKVEEEETCLRDHQQTIKDEEEDMMGTIKEEEGETSIIAGHLPVGKGYTMVKIKQEETCVRGDQQTMGERDMMETIKEEKEEIYRRAGQLSTEEGSIKLEEEETCLRGDQQTAEEADLMGTIKEEEGETSIMAGQLSMGVADMMGTTEVKEETCVTEDQQSTEDGDVRREIKPEEVSPDISTAGGKNVGDTLEGQLMSHPDDDAENDGIMQCSPGGFPVTRNADQPACSVDRSMDSSDPKESSDLQCEEGDGPSERSSAGPNTASQQLPSMESVARPLDNRLYVCSECGKSHKYHKAFVQHLRVHRGERPFTCLKCPQSFTLNAHLKKHLLTHRSKSHGAGVSTSCPKCGKLYRDKLDLDRHLRVHTDERPFPCTECNQRFKLKNHLKMHLMLHTGETPFTCADCGRGFKRKANFLAHQRTHVRIIVYSGEVVPNGPGSMEAVSLAAASLAVTVSGQAQPPTHP